MRYRIKTYTISNATGSSNYLDLRITIPADIYDSLTTASGSPVVLSDESLNFVRESLRLVADETRDGYVVCSTGLKNTLYSGWLDSNNVIVIRFRKEDLITAADGDANDLAAIAAMAASDRFTIEFDWGEAPEDLGGGSDEYSQELAEFFGLPDALPGSYVPATDAEIIEELENIWEYVTGEEAPVVEIES